MGFLNTAVECYRSCTPPLDPQYWADTTIELSAVDASFGNTVQQKNQATNTPVTTSDGGKTWTIAKITVPVVDFVKRRVF